MSGGESKDVDQLLDGKDMVLPPPRFGYGQDESGRDVIIKVINKGVVEHDINQYLLANQCLCERSAFPNVLSPVAMLDSPYDFSFLVMPLWSPAFRAGHALETVGHVMLFMKCLLTGLAFLHDNRIAHRDINTSNMLMNCYNACGEDFAIVQLIRDYTRSSPKLAYCLFDFNLSRRFPLNTDLRTAPYHPPDYWHGEPEFNPFSFDVACLGNLFLHRFMRVIPIVPTLAPLLAGMTTHVIERRFTASEALDFYREHLGQLPEETLATRVATSAEWDGMNDPDVYWRLLTPEHQDRWSHLRVPRKPWKHKVLERIASIPYGWQVLHALRCWLHV
ncbi:kinase-like domain-containing protein [Trametes maxima]|nr:kinase-like domain-containing protein [Trametes maxima]